MWHMPVHFEQKSLVPNAFRILPPTRFAGKWLRTVFKLWGPKMKSLGLHIGKNSTCKECHVTLSTTFSYMVGGIILQQINYMTEVKDFSDRLL